MINYTFIIPHKDVPSLLLRCINSIPDREDVEVIVVDDNSIKKPIDEAKLPSRRGKMSLISLGESKGAGNARNVGVKRASGRWLLFADADDFYTDNINVVLNKYQDIDDIDIVYLNAQFFYEENKLTKPTSFDRYFKRFEANKFYSENVLRYYMWSPWTRMVSKKLVYEHCIEFEQIPTGNDKMFSLRCSQYAKSIATESSFIYNYCMAQDKSVTYSYTIKPEVLSTKLALLFRSNELYKEVGFIFKDSLLYEYLAKYKNNQTEPRKTIYSDAFKRKDYNVMVDTWRMFKYVIAKAFKIL